VSVGVITVVFMCRSYRGLTKLSQNRLKRWAQINLGDESSIPALAISQIQKNCIARTQPRRRRRDSSGSASVLSVSPLYRKIAETVRFEDKQNDTPICSGSRRITNFTQSSYVGRGRFITIWLRKSPTSAWSARFGAGPFSLHGSLEKK